MRYTDQLRTRPGNRDPHAALHFSLCIKNIDRLQLFWIFYLKNKIEARAFWKITIFSLERVSRFEIHKPMWYFNYCLSYVDQLQTCHWIRDPRTAEVFPSCMKTQLFTNSWLDSRFAKCLDTQIYEHECVLSTTYQRVLGFKIYTLVSLFRLFMKCSDHLRMRIGIPDLQTAVLSIRYQGVLGFKIPTLLSLFRLCIKYNDNLRAKIEVREWYFLCYR